MIASFTQLLSQAYEVTEIEAIASCHALEFGLEVGINEAILEGDCLAIRQALKDGGSSMASVKPLILDALWFFCSFTKLLYSHTKRNGNRLAHGLARHSINVNDYVVWMEDVPPPFFSIVQAVEMGSCGLNCHKPKPNSTRNIIPSAADFDIYILGLRYIAAV